MTCAPGSPATRRADDAGFRDALAAELTKVRTLPATWIALLIALAAKLALGIIAATHAIRIASADGAIPVTQMGTLMLSPVYAFIAIAVFAGGSEYGGGQLRVTLAAVPDRTVLFTAKLAATAAVSLLATVLAVLPGYLIQHISALVDGEVSLGAASADFAALVAVYLLLSLIGLGFAVVARSVITPLAVLFIAPVLVSPAFQNTIPDIVKLLPHEAALSLLGTPATPDTELTPSAALSALACWAAAGLFLAWNALSHRDAR